MRRLLLAVTLAACSSPPRPAPVPPVSDPPVSDPTPKPAESDPMPPPVTIPTQTAVPQELQFPDEDFRTKQPGAGAPRPFRMPKVKPFTLESGLKVYLVEQHQLPIVSLDLNFDGGAMTDPKGKEGLASVCMSMLTEGTEKLDKIQYAEALADIASSINAYASDDASGLGMNSLSKHFDTTFAQFVETLLHPGFRDKDFDRMIKRRIEGVRQSKGTPASVAGRVAGTVLYGAAHPFGTVVTEESLKAITIDDCKGYVATYLKPKNARLFVVGDLTEQQIRQHFKSDKLAAWKGAGKAVAALPRPQSLQGRIFFVHIPNAAQSQVWHMHFGPTRTAADYFPNTIMAAIFGGGFSSRINMNLREEKGYSYGARGSFSYSKQYGTFTANASVRTDATYQTLLEIDREVKELWSNKAPVKPDELEREKQGAILGLPGQFATGQAALGQYRRLVYYGLPLDYYATYATKVGAVNAGQVTAAAKKHLKPGQAMYLVVGDGDAEMKIRVDGKDVPYLKDGKPVTLRTALADLAARGDVGTGGLVELDTDGRIKPAR
jgi:predicted Zn-dependent peptidase